MKIEGGKGVDLYRLSLAKKAKALEKLSISDVEDRYVGAVHSLKGGLDIRDRGRRIYRYIQEQNRRISSEDLRAYKVKRERKPLCVGYRRKFWVWDFSAMPPKHKQIWATLRGKGKHAYIFVADDSWGKTVKEEDVKRIKETFEHRTPPSSVDPYKGIYDIDTSTFGDPPDAIDKDPRIYILISDMAEYNGAGFDGYFNAFDELPDKVAWEKYHQHSNEVEILYLNSGSKETPISSDYMLSVLAHEFQHMIHYNYDTDEETWLNESMSEAAMTVSGYFTDKKHLKEYASNPASPLFSNSHVDYGAVLLWGTYLYEKYGRDFLKALVENKENGVSSIDETLKRMGYSENFASLFSQWVATNYASGEGIISDKYNYKSFPVPSMKIEKEVSSFPDEFSSSVKPSGVHFIKISSQDKVKLTIDGSGEDCFVQIMKFDGNNFEVKPMPLNGEGGTFHKELEIKPEKETVLAFYTIGEEDMKYSVNFRM